MPFVYILFSKSINKYYVGATSETVEDRLERHLSHYYDNKFTAKANDWVVYLSVECSSMKQAIDIEKQIKAMKSKTYIENLERYPEMVEKLLAKYCTP